MNKLLLACALALLIAGCMGGSERDLYRKVQVSCEIVIVNPTEYRWDIITIEYPNGHRRHLRMPRGLYQPGDVYHVQMRKWQKLERAVIGD